jgi:hypothetical protein
MSVHLSPEELGRAMAEQWPSQSKLAKTGSYCKQVAFGENGWPLLKIGGSPRINN